MSESFTYEFEQGTTELVVIVGVQTPAADTTNLGPSYPVVSVQGAYGSSIITGEIGTGAGSQDIYDVNQIFAAPNDGAPGGSHYGLDVYGIRFSIGNTDYRLSYSVVFHAYVLNDIPLTLAASDAPCYCAGTLILTDAGEAPIEGLAVGDRLVTAAGAVRTLRWVGRRSYAGRFLAGNPRMRPVRFAAGSLGGGLPRRDLLVSPEHAMLLDGVLVPAHLLVNGGTIAQACGLERVDYLHLELDSHDVILAEGAASETFLDDDSRGLFENGAEFAAAGRPGAAQAGGFCAPRVESGYRLDTIRRRLAGIASTMGRAALDCPASLAMTG